LSPNWHQTRSKTNPVPSVSAITLCFASKACIYNVTANWQQKPSKFCVTLFDDKLAAKIEQILYSTTPILRDNMQGLLGFRSQFVVRQRYARFARFLLTICHQVT